MTDLHAGRRAATRLASWAVAVSILLLCSGCPCPSGQHRCSGQCVSDAALATCGSSCEPCAVPAHGAATCDGTSCGAACDAGYHACGSSCASNAEVASCGASCTPCPTPPANAVATCDGASCGFTCDAGFHRCARRPDPASDAGLVDVCTSDFDTGSCGTSCTPCPATLNADPTCDGTACGFACRAGYHVCGNACGWDADPATCGTSCTPCIPPANAIATCDGVSCGFACYPGYVLCGGACCLPAPANVAATPGPARVTVTWDAIPVASAYHVYWSRTAGVTPATGTLVSVEAPPFQHSPLMPGVPVYYVVTAILPAGEGQPSVEVSATPERAYGTVAALYPVNGAGWNDYVKNDGATRLAASDTACDPVADTGGYSSCLHGGEMRAFTAALPVGCAGVTAEDDAAPGGALNWTCDSSAGDFRVVSTGLQEGRFLSDLIARDPVTNLPGWKQLILRVWKDGALVSLTQPTVWWSNPVVDVTTQSQLASAGTVYVAGVGRSPNVQGLAVTAPRVALLAEAGSDIFMLSASGLSFLWLEGSLGMFNNFGPALSWSGVDHSVIRGLGAITCPNDCPVLFVAARDSAISDVTTALGTGSALYTSTTTWARLHFTGGFSFGSTDAQWVGHAVGGQNNVFTQVTVSGGAWFALGDARSLGGHALVGFTGANATPTLGSPFPARLLEMNGAAGSKGNTAAHLAVTNGDVGLAVDGAGNRIVDVAACDNGIHGVEDWAAGTSWDGWLIVGGNGSSDCWKTGGTSTCPSGPTLTTNCALAGAFVGKVTAPDPVNGSISNPAGPVSGITDWTRFVDRWRGWGKDSPDPFPAASNRGTCLSRSSSSDCRMWDWSLMVGPAWLMGNATGRLVTHEWYRATPPASQADCDALVRGSIFALTSPPGVNACYSFFLLGAIEVAGDGIGNDNGLCENGETCLIAPNLGSYQGHGALVFVRAFEPLPGFRVNLVAREWNGYSVGNLP